MRERRYSTEDMPIYFETNPSFRPCFYTVVVDPMHPSLDPYEVFHLQSGIAYTTSGVAYYIQDDRETTTIVRLPALAEALDCDVTDLTVPVIRRNLQSALIHGLGRTFRDNQMIYEELDKTCIARISPHKSIALRLVNTQGVSLQ